jgi:hypothetical protein
MITGTVRVNPTSLVTIIDVKSSYRVAIYWERSSQSCRDLPTDAPLE